MVGWQRQWCTNSTHPDNVEEDGHTCSICGKSVATASSLQKHIRERHSRTQTKPTRTAAAPYQSQKCSSPQVMLKSLSPNQRVEQPRPSGRPSRTAALAANTVTRHKPRPPFECPICFKNLKTPSGLLRHNKIHISGKPYPCRVCNTEFAKSGFLYRHMSEKHGLSPRGAEGGAIVSGTSDAAAAAARAIDTAAGNIVANGGMSPGPVQGISSLGGNKAGPSATTTTSPSGPRTITNGLSGQTTTTTSSSGSGSTTASPPGSRNTNTSSSGSRTTTTSQSGSQTNTTTAMTTKRNPTGGIDRGNNSSVANETNGPGDESAVGNMDDGDVPIVLFNKAEERATMIVDVIDVSSSDSEKETESGDAGGRAANVKSSPSVVAGNQQLGAKGQPDEMDGLMESFIRQVNGRKNVLEHSCKKVTQSNGVVHYSFDVLFKQK